MNSAYGTPHNPIFGRGSNGQALWNQGQGFHGIGSAPTDVRWAWNSGTGNYQASHTAADQIANMDPGRPNSLDTPDSGVNRFGRGAYQTVDSEGGYSPSSGNLLALYAALRGRSG